MTTMFKAYGQFMSTLSAHLNGPLPQAHTATPSCWASPDAHRAMWTGAENTGCTTPSLLLWMDWGQKVGQRAPQPWRMAETRDQRAKSLSLDVNLGNAEFTQTDNKLQVYWINEIWGLLLQWFANLHMINFQIQRGPFIIKYPIWNPSVTRFF